MELTKKNINICIGVTKKVSDIAICLSIPFSGMAMCCVKKLLTNCSDVKELMNGSEEAALAFALFELIRDKLSGSALEVYKTKVSNVSCYALNGNLVIRWNTQGTVTSLRKTCGIVVSCLTPSKLFTKYTENIKFLCGKNGNKETFNFCVKKLSESIKKNIYIVAIGKINIDKTKLEDLLDTVLKKMPDQNIPLAKEIETPEKRTSAKIDLYPLIKCSGLAAVAVADYIRSSSNGMAVEVTSQGVIVFNHSWETKHKQLKDSNRIVDYVEKKYDRLEEEFPAVYAYFSLTQNYIDSDTLKKILKNLKPAKLIELIKKTL